ncbi:MAG: type II secretion system F family protein [Negativicutes bacterium]|nr:type II secretion system F family protein [Negativicutes bacterium]
MLLVITLIATITVFIVVYLLISASVPVQGQVAVRLKALDGSRDRQGDIDELAKPFAQRVLAPLTENLAESLGRFTPSVLRRMVDQKLAAAGGFGGLSTDGFLTLCGFLGIGGGLFTGALTTLGGGLALGPAVIALVVGAAIPVLSLNQKIAARKKSIQRDLPDVLDLLTVSIEAGLGFDGALAKLAEKMKGALVDEFGRTLQEMRIGVPRRDALHAMGQRCEVSDLSLFTAALVQADQLGVSLGNVLRVQSTAMREKRRQRAQEKAMKAPVKMLLPLVMFIFPAIFVVVLGPAAIRIVAALAQK